MTMTDSLHITRLQQESVFGPSYVYLQQYLD